MKRLLLIITILFTISIHQSFAQKKTEENQKEIFFELKPTHLGNNLYKFELKLPSIEQVISAQTPHYSYYMNYGDGYVDFGHFDDLSDTLSLFHVYDSIPTEVIFCETKNNYGHGTKPPNGKIIPNTIGVTSTHPGVNHHEMMQGSNNNGVKIQPTFYPKKYGIDGPFSIQPEDDIALILSYKNQEVDITNGQLVLLFDKRQFSVNETQTYHYEKEIDKKAVRVGKRNIDLENTGILAWEVNKLSRGKEQQIIVDFHVLKERVQKESTFQLIFIPESGSAKMATPMADTVEISLLDERDPNKMSGKINKKLFKKEDYNYTVQFFNEGDGPVTDITLEIKDIKFNWEKDKFVITQMNIAGIDIAKADLESKYELEFKKNIVVVKLKDVRLEGLNAEDLEKIEHAYATINFEVEPKKDWKKTRAKTSIIFSDKDPVVTNTTSIFPQNRYFLGIEAGYAYDFMDTDPLARDEGVFFRGVTGWRFTDRISAVAEFGLLPSNTETEGDNSVTKESYFLNPQVVTRLNTWWKVGAGVSMLRQKTSNYSNNVFISSTIDDSFRFLIDTHITPIQNRIFNVNIGARYYQPFDRNFDNSLHAYVTLRINILE